jgi:uncharacterized protein YbaP (TraB family)
MTEEKRLTQINAYVPAEIKQEFKLECLKAGKTMSDVIEELVRSWLDQRLAPVLVSTGVRGVGEVKDDEERSP